MQEERIAMMFVFVVGEDKNIYIKEGKVVGQLHFYQDHFWIFLHRPDSRKKKFIFEFLREIFKYVFKQYQ